MIKANVQRLRRSEAPRAAIMGKLTLAWRIAADLKVNGAVSRLPEFAAQLALISAGVDWHGYLHDLSH